MKNEYESITYHAPQRYLLSDLKTVSTILSTTPDVSNQEIFINDGVARTITNFQFGAEGQVIRILGDNNLTIANNTQIKTSTGASKMLAASKMFRFTCINSVWYEDA